MQPTRYRVNDSSPGTLSRNASPLRGVIGAVNGWLGLLVSAALFAATVATHSDAVAQQPPLVSAPVQAKIDADVLALLSATHTPGATVAIVEHGAIGYTRGYGLRELATSLPADAHTRYEIGSITKQFTAAAILQLKETGKIDLNATVATYLPLVPHAADITIRELLTQTQYSIPFCGPSARKICSTSSRAEPATSARL